MERPDGTAGMLVEAVERDPEHREANIKYLRANAEAHREAGNLMHLGIFEDAIQYLEANPI